MIKYNFTILQQRPERGGDRKSRIAEGLHFHSLIEADVIDRESTHRGHIEVIWRVMISALSLALSN